MSKPDDNRLRVDLPILQQIDKMLPSSTNIDIRSKVEYVLQDWMRMQRMQGGVMKAKVIQAANHIEEEDEEEIKESSKLHSNETKGW